MYFIIELGETLTPSTSIFTNKKDFNRYKSKCELYYYDQKRNLHYDFNCYYVKWSKNKKEFLHNLCVTFITHLNPIWNEEH